MNGMFKHAVTKSSLAGALALGLITGCGGGGSGGNDVPSEPEVAHVAGAAVKGVIRNGVVTVFAITADGNTGMVLAEGFTNADGSYSLTVDDYKGPVLIEITALSPGAEHYPSLMVCDIPGTDSCYNDADDANDIGFGEYYTLGSGFSLKAVVPEVNKGSVNANVTALTDLAASLAESTGITADSIHLANSQVANLFGLLGDITQLPVVDLTNAEALNSFSAASAQETEDALKSAMLSAAILAALKADGATIDTATSMLSNQFIGNTGQLINNESGNNATTLAEILDHAINLINSELSGSGHPDMNQIATYLQADLTTANSAAEGSLTAAVPSEENLSDGFLKARGLVQDLRDISTAASLEDITTGATAFADNLAIAGELINADTGSAKEVIILVATAMAEAAEQNATGTYMSEEGIEISIDRTGPEPVYTYITTFPAFTDWDGTYYSPMAVDITGYGVISVEEQGDPSQDEAGTKNISGHFNLEGNITTDLVEVIVQPGSDITVTGFQENWTISESNSSTEKDRNRSITSIGINFDVDVAQLQSDTPASFSGNLSTTLNGFSRVTSRDSSCVSLPELPQGCVVTRSENSTTQFNDLSVVLNGTFSQGGESFAATLVVNAVNNDYTQTESSWRSFWSEQSWYVLDDGSAASTETDSEYVSVNFSLNMDTSLTGISDQVFVRLSGDRQAMETGTANMRLQFEGKTIDADLLVSNADSGRDAVLTVTNNQGAVLTVVESNIDDDIDDYEGTIKANGAQQATVSDENDIIVVRYNGGYVESF